MTCLGGDAAKPPATRLRKSLHLGSGRRAFFRLENAPNQRRSRVSKDRIAHVRWRRGFRASAAESSRSPGSHEEGEPAWKVFGAEQGRGDLLTLEQGTHPDCRIALNRGLDAILLPVASRTTLQSAAQLETKRCLVTYIALFGLLSQSVLTAGVFSFSRFAAAVATSRSAQPFLGKSSAAPSERYSVLMSQRISGLRGMDGRLLPLCQRGSHHHDLH